MPGREGALDVPDASGLGVTIQGEAFPPLLFEWGAQRQWLDVRGAGASEPVEALVAGWQGAVWTLGAVPAVVRHDHRSAAPHEPTRSGGRPLTERFRGVLDHDGWRSSRIQPGEAHEHGVAAQALRLRGQADFVDEADGRSLRSRED